MSKDSQMKKIKKNIEKKRSRLNLLAKGDLDRKEVLDLSQELDLLINEYYKIAGDRDGKK